MQESLGITNIIGLECFKNFDLVIFDFDGTLFLTEKYHQNAYDIVGDNYEKKCKKYIELVNEKCPEVHPTGYEMYEYCKKHCINVAIASSTLRINIDAILKKASVDFEFDFINSGDLYVLNNKPHPDIFNDTVKHFGVPKEKVLIIEDSSNGFEAAAQANLRYVDVNKFVL